LYDFFKQWKNGAVSHNIVVVALVGVDVVSSAIAAASSP
jgi:hypothetical protein